MAHKAFLVNPEKLFAVAAKSVILEPSNPEMFTYPASNVAFNLARCEDVRGGYLFLDCAPTVEEAKAIAAAELKQVIYQEKEMSEDQVAACQLLEQFGIGVIYNPNIIIKR